VRRAEETRDGALALRVAFDDYRDGFPHLVEVGAASGATARLAYEAVERNRARRSGAVRAAARGAGAAARGGPPPEGR